MKHFIVNHFGIHLIHLHFCIELDCSQGRWTRSWGACCVKPEHVFSSDNLRSCGLDPNLRSSFNSCIETYTMSYFLPARQGLTSCMGGELLRGGETLRKRQEKKRSEWIILQTGFRLLICFIGLYCDCCSTRDRDSTRRTPGALCKCLWQAVSCFASAWSSLCHCLVHLGPIPSSRLFVLYLNNPLRPGRTTSSLYPSVVASPVLAIQHILPQKCFELDNEILVWQLCLFVCFPLFSKHCHEWSSVHYRQVKKRKKKAIDLYRVCKAHV